jgi:hypothetical protein
VPQSDDGAQRIARDLVPAVERAMGMRFKRQPAIVTRSREQLRGYLERKVRADYPPAEIRAQDRAYKALRLIPDTLDLLKAQLDLLQQQVLAFYDPDSSGLFIIRGSDPAMLRAVVAHELVHALQDQYTDLNAILKAHHQNDRQTAGQAVMEGQASVAGLQAISPTATLEQIAAAFEQGGDALLSGQASDAPGMAGLASYPRILRDHLIFAYVRGAIFIIEFNQRRASPDEQPYGERLPVSSEQILHPSKYTAGEVPRRVSIAATPGDTLIYDDDFGEFDTHVALGTWGEREDIAAAAASGWNGDRFAILGTRGGTAIVWAAAWDTPNDAAEFERALRRAWPRATQGRDGNAARRWQLDTIEQAGVKVVRLIDAPTAWSGWRRLPRVTVSGASR